MGRCFSSQNKVWNRGGNWQLWQGRCSFWEQYCFTDGTVDVPSKQVAKNAVFPRTKSGLTQVVPVSLSGYVWHIGGCVLFLWWGWWNHIARGWRYTWHPECLAFCFFTILTVDLKIQWLAGCNLFQWEYLSDCSSLNISMNSMYWTRQCICNRKQTANCVTCSRCLWYYQTSCNSQIIE